MPTTLNRVIAGQLEAVNQAVRDGVAATTTNPIINSVNWVSPNPLTQWFPTLRVDYTARENLRLNLAVNRTITDQPFVNAPLFPGEKFH